MNNNDLISRQAAIDTYLETVSSLCVDEGDGILTACARDRDILEMLENLPSVQPKTGRWIPIKPLLTAARCSECKGVVNVKVHSQRERIIARTAAQRWRKRNERKNVRERMQANF